MRFRISPLLANSCVDPRRLAKKGYTAQKKLDKSQPSEALKKRRVLFARKHEHKSPADWKSCLQAVGDIKEFTFYPKQLKPRFSQLKAPWTYMNKKEKYQAAFQRPKRWFSHKDYKQVQKQKLFGLTTSTGKICTFLVPKPWSAEVWAKRVEKKVGPFLKKCFPGKNAFQILLDGEKILHAPPGKRAMSKCGIKVMPGWPKYSPELNPQENVWPWAEKELRRLEKKSDTFQTFQKNVERAVQNYKSGNKLVGSMTKRCRQCIDRRGDMLSK